MSLQTPLDVKVKEEEPVDVDSSSSPSSPDSQSSESDAGYREPPSMKKVGERSNCWDVRNTKKRILCLLLNVCHSYVSANIHMESQINLYFIQCALRSHQSSTRT